MGLLGSLFSAAADIAKETITETMNQNETEKFIKIMMERDAQNAEANEKLYQDWLTHERSNYFAAKKNTIIHDAFDVLMDSFEDTGKFDFSAVDSLSDELKNSDSYKQEAADVVNLCCEALVKLHQKCCISIRFVMQTIHNLQRFADIVPSIRGLDRHYDAFFPVDNADCSFLTDFDSIAEGLEAAKNDSDNYLAMVGSNSPLSRLAALKDILKSEDYVAAVSNLLFADQEVAPYAGMKKMILCLSMEETDEATALLLDTYCTVIMNYLRLSTAKEKVGKDNPFISASTEQILPIDLLIAQSIKSSKSGSPQEVDTNLDEFLEYYPLICTSSWEDQLFILQKVFAYLKMYSQERKVLEFFVKKETKKPDLCHLSKGGFCSRARLKISKGQVVFFEKITQKISTFKPLPIFILSVLSSLPKARLSKNKIFIVFRFSSVTDKTTQNKKDTREVSRIFYSAIAPFNGTKRFEFLL